MRSLMPGRVDLGPLEDVLESVAAGPVYAATMRGYLVRVDADQRDALAAAVDPMLHPGLDAGVLALYQKCPHLGCRVPVCDTSGWFECPCHGSRYSPFGEHRDGPGPRGMDAFPLEVEEGRVVADTGRLAMGLPVGSVVVDVAALGPHCVEPPSSP